MTLTPDLLQRCWFLAGPTACGKTAVSLALAQRLNAEIVVLDSMTVYRGMDIGTAKATLGEQACVPHHLLNIVDPHADFSLAEYLTAAEACCREIIGRGHTPLFVGGTGLYLRGVLRGVFEGPAADWPLRHELAARADTDGAESLHHELAQFDAATAARLHPNDIRRVIRAIEVYRLTGRPLCDQHENRPRPLTERTPHVYWLSPNRDWLHARINARVDQMFTAGLISEVQSLIVSPRPLSQTARQALGYKEVIDWLTTLSNRVIAAPNAGPDVNTRASKPDVQAKDAASETFACASGLDETLDRLATSPPRELVELIQTRTRQFAKRQHTWFRNLEECVPLEIGEDDKVDALADRIVDQRQRRENH